MKQARRDKQQEREVAAKQLHQEQKEHRAQISALHDKLEAIEKELFSARKEAEEAEMGRNRLDAEMRLWRTSAGRYKKKVSCAESNPERMLTDIAVLCAQSVYEDIPTRR